MTTYLSDYCSYTVNDVVVSDLKIELRETDFNYASFVYPYQISTGTVITIMYGKTAEVFTGKVTQCKKLERTIDGKTRYDIEIVEPAIELENNYITTATITGLYINNNRYMCVYCRTIYFHEPLECSVCGGKVFTRDNKTLGQYVDNIIDGVKANNWYDASDYKYKSMKAPEGVNIDKIPSMGFTNCTVANALRRVINTVFNYGLWFEYKDNGNSKRIIYGKYRRDIYPNMYPTPISVSMIEKSTKHNIDGVIVYGDTNKQYAAVGSIGKNKKLVIYRYNQCNSIEELRAVAQRIWDDRREPQTRFEITFPAQYFEIHEGDRIHIYDTQSGLVYNEDGYLVKDVTITNTKIVVGIGSAKTTVFEILNDRLSTIDGSMMSFNTEEFDTGWINLSASSSPENWGNIASAEFTIKGETFFGNFILSPVCGAEQIEGASPSRVYATLADAQEYHTITPDSPMYMSAKDSFLPSWFPWTWKWVDMEATYIFDPDTTDEGAMVDWDVVWGSEELGVIMSASNGMIVDSGGTIPSSAVYSTVIHRWYVNGATNVPYSYPVFIAQCHEGTDSVTLKDIRARVAVFWESDTGSGYAPVETTAASCEIEMRVKYTDTDYTKWIPIYKTENPGLYIGKEYDMEGYIPNSQFKTGKHLIEFHMKGTGKASVRVYGRYSSFDEKTEIIL